MSWQELDAYQKSPEFQTASAPLDYIRVGEGRLFPIMRDWCLAVPGNRPTLCPNADPPADERDRQALQRYLPEIERLYREAGLLGDGQTIHWVGRETRI